eukprot:scaffold1881_cov62-Phaeocystis_antarctica.AAC.5
MPDPSSGLTQLDADNRWANLKMSEVGITSTTPRDLAAYISRLGTERPYACAVGHGAPPSGGVLGPHAGAVSLVELDEEPAERAGQGAGADGRVGFDLDVEVARDDQGFALLLNRVPRAAADLEDPLGGGAGGAAHVEGGDDRVSFCSGEGGAGAERVDVGALEDAGDVHDLLNGLVLRLPHLGAIGARVLGKLALVETCLTHVDTLIKAVDDVARLGRRDVTGVVAVAFWYGEAGVGGPERLAGVHVHLGHEAVQRSVVEVGSSVYLITIRRLGIDQHNVGFARERQFAAERATDRDHVVLIGERIDVEELGLASNATVDAAIEAVGAELVRVQGFEGVRIRVGVGGERVRAEDFDGHPRLCDLVDHCVHAVLRGAVLIEISAGEELPVAWWMVTSVWSSATKLEPAWSV